MAKSIALSCVCIGAQSLTEFEQLIRFYQTIGMRLSERDNYTATLLSSNQDLKIVLDMNGNQINTNSNTKICLYTNQDLHVRLI